MKGQSLLSVGIDIGTTTTQLVFSRLTVQNEAGAFSVPQFAITEKEVLYRSKIYFTPLLSNRVIDGTGIREIVDREYAASGFQKEEIQTGAVIITGETARKENAGQVLSSLAGYAGDFVVATAGPALESVLAGKGSGAQNYSEVHHCSVLNLDIGGGTTNMALFHQGRLADTGCLNVGGRLIKLSQGKITYLSPVLENHTELKVGQAVTEQELQPVIDLLVSVLELAVTEPQRIPAGFITDKTLALEGEPYFTFSGGVADLIAQTPENPFAYGDIGVLLGKALRRSSLCSHRWLPAAETIRATVIGAGSHSTDLSGSTIFYRDITFPLKNLPVAALSPRDEALDSPALAEKIRSLTALYDRDVPVVLSLSGQRNPKFSELCKLADGIAAAKEAEDQPLIIAVREDMGKALGQAIGTLLPGTPLLCLDGLSLPEGAYLDIGAPVAQGQALPVVIKTLVL